MKKLLLIAILIFSCQQQEDTITLQVDNLENFGSGTQDEILSSSKVILEQYGWSVHNPKPERNRIFRSSWRDGYTIYYRLYSNNSYTVTLRDPNGPNKRIEGDGLIEIMDTLDELTGYVQPLDYNNPQVYIDMFVADAAEYGYDFDAHDGTVLIADLEGPIGRSIKSCDDGYNILLDDYFWEQNSDYIRKKFLVYHELGHALLELDHNCYIWGYSPGYDRYVFRYDLMWAGNVCAYDNLAYVGSKPWDSEQALAAAAEDMFNLDNQNIKDCDTSKGPVIYTCDFNTNYLQLTKEDL